MLARHVIRSGLCDHRGKVLEKAELLTSELVTNAILHGHSTPTLILEVRDDHIRVEVKDSDPTMNLEPLDVETSSAHGRGLAIVAAMASSWGVEPQHDGKAVWFQLDL